MAELKISIVQPDIVWEDKEQNLNRYEHILGTSDEKLELVVLPEMFSTGFSMNPESLAEDMDGPTVQWMKRFARERYSVITGSLIIRDSGKFYNRLLWVLPTGDMGYYDKRHLFGYGGEKKEYHRGNKRLIARLKGFRICLQICYDLRFPVWSRNRGGEYDLLINVANWPSSRIQAWETLLKARAIENQAYVLGVNRVGRDPQGIGYPGRSALIDPEGLTQWQGGADSALVHQTIRLEKLAEIRKNFPFLEDADPFFWADPGSSD